MHKKKLVLLVREEENGVSSFKLGPLVVISAAHLSCRVKQSSSEAKKQTAQARASAPPGLHSSAPASTVCSTEDASGLWLMGRVVRTAEGRHHSRAEGGSKDPHNPLTSIRTRRDT